MVDEVLEMASLGISVRLLRTAEETGGKLLEREVPGR